MSKINFNNPVKMAYNAINSGKGEGFIPQPLDEETKTTIESRLGFKISEPMHINVKLSGRQELARWGRELDVVISPDTIWATTTYADAWSWNNPERSEDAAYAIKYFFRIDEYDSTVEVHD